MSLEDFLSEGLDPESLQDFEVSLFEKKSSADGTTATTQQQQQQHSSSSSSSLNGTTEAAEEPVFRILALDDPTSILNYIHYLLILSSIKRSSFIIYLFIYLFIYFAC